MVTVQKNGCLDNLLPKLQEKFEKGCQTIMENISVAIFINLYKHSIETGL